MKKTKKAEIATFLTLGLVLVGAVLSLLSGVMVNRQKNIASNPRAGYDTGMPGSLLSPYQKTPTKTPPSTSTPIRTSTPAPTITQQNINNNCSNGKCGSGCKYNCPTGESLCLNKPNLEFRCCVAKTGVFYGCVGTPCNMIGDGKTYIPCGDYVSPTPFTKITPIQGDDPSLLGQNKCGSGLNKPCDPDLGYDPSCVAREGPDLAFRCCVFRSNGEVVDYGCVGTPCSAYNKDWLRPCSGYSGYQSDGPGSLLITTSPTKTPSPTPPTPGAGASSNKLCSSDNDCQSGYKCIPIPSGYGYKYCASPTPTPPTPGPGTGAPAGSTTSTCPPQTVCSRATGSWKNECGVGYDPLKSNGEVVKCDYSQYEKGICCIPKVVQRQITTTITPPVENMTIGYCVDYCSSQKKLSRNPNNIYYKSCWSGSGGGSNCIYYDSRQDRINSLYSHCGCTDEISQINNDQTWVCEQANDDNPDDNVAYQLCCLDEAKNNCYLYSYKFR